MDLDNSGDELILKDSDKENVNDYNDKMIMEDKMDKIDSDIILNSDLPLISMSHTQGKRSLTHSKKPGVILLGRGNSFSLGRSEVILLHHRHKPLNKRTNSRSVATADYSNDDKIVTGLDSGDIFHRMVTIEESNDGRDIRRRLSNDFIEDERVSSCPTNPSPSPPPISNGLCHTDSQRSSSDEDSVVDLSSNPVLDLVPCYSEDLKDLWLKAESVMLKKNDRVKKILEEFGIGEPGRGGGDEEGSGGDDDWENEDVEERKKEEEEVWRIIQDDVRL